MATSGALALVRGTPDGARPSPGDRLARGVRLASAGAGRGLAALYASLLVLLPLAAVSTKAFDGGFGAFLGAVRQPESLSAIELTFACAAGVAVLNSVVGTAVAWVLVRDRFPGKRVVDAMVDLPLALPTVVAGIVLLSLYGSHSPVAVDVAFTRTAIIAALAFVTLPFSVRAVQPVIAELDRDAEQAAASLGAGPVTVLRRIVLPALLPALLTGAGLSFARALGEFGSVVLLSGNIPFHTELASVRIFGLVESGTLQAASAVSLVLLAGSLAVLAGFSLIRRRVLPSEAAA